MDPLGESGNVELINPGTALTHDLLFSEIMFPFCFDHFELHVLLHTALATILPVTHTELMEAALLAEENILRQSSLLQLLPHPCDRLSLTEVVFLALGERAASCEHCRSCACPFTTRSTVRSGFDVNFPDRCSRGGHRQGPDTTRIPPESVC